MAVQSVQKFYDKYSFHRRKCPPYRISHNFQEEKQLSQEVVSGFADIGRTHLSAIERGIRKPTLETLFRIAEALKVPPSALVAEIEEAVKKAAN
ncbi:MULTISPECIES: helix-turn-helix domain-containing protein [Anaerotruncus]|uniref:helix-turn-helix domain-containing protein n=1 Tax=Anaerotruncus TaxID=244127 RepID=UPI00191C35B2|nr:MULTISPECIES: helix-turn-helix transcriptional regulator [Anaerotruncus]